MKRLLSFFLILSIPVIFIMADITGSFSGNSSPVDTNHKSMQQLKNNLFISSDGTFLCFDFRYCNDQDEPILGIGFLDTNGDNSIEYNRYFADENVIYFENNNGYEIISYSLSSDNLIVQYLGEVFELDIFEKIECPFWGKRYFEGSIFDGFALDLTYTYNDKPIIGIRKNRETDYKYYYFACSNNYLLLSLTEDMSFEHGILFSYKYKDEKESLTLVDIEGSLFDLSAPMFIRTPFNEITYKQYVFRNGLVLNFTELDGIPIVGIKEPPMNEMRYYHYKCDKDYLYIGDVSRIDECSVIGYSISNSGNQLKLFYRNGSCIELNEAESKEDELKKDAINALFGLGGVILGIINFTH